MLSSQLSRLRNFSCNVPFKAFFQKGWVNIENSNFRFEFPMMDSTHFLEATCMPFWSPYRILHTIWHLLLIICLFCSLYCHASKTRARHMAYLVIIMTVHFIIVLICAATNSHEDVIRLATFCSLSLPVSKLTVKNKSDICDIWHGTLACQAFLESTIFLKQEIKFFFWKIWRKDHLQTWSCCWQML